MNIGTLFRRIESANQLDGPSTGLQRRILDAAAHSPTTRKVASILRGSPVEHPLHPALVAVPIGAWTASVVFDYVAREPKTVRNLILLGLVTTPPALVTGWLDWSERNTIARRVGLVHAASNAVGIDAFLVSYFLRSNDFPPPPLARLLSLVGLSAIGVGGALGGHIVFRLMEDPDTEAASAPVLDPALNVVN